MGNMIWYALSLDRQYNQLCLRTIDRDDQLHPKKDEKQNMRVLKFIYNVDVDS